MKDVEQKVSTLCLGAKRACSAISNMSHADRNRLISDMAAEIRLDSAEILAENQKDLDCAAANGVPHIMLDRLRLNPTRITAISDSLCSLCLLPDPLKNCKNWRMPSGIAIEERRVPLGVVAIIYEARPNVTADAAGLCIKSGNAVVLRGGKEALLTNTALVSSMQKVLKRNGIPESAISLITDPTRESAAALMRMRGLIDVLIPRGGKNLIRDCLDNARVPVIETGAGNCHIYVDAEADLQKALRVTVNAKCQRPSVCNAAESLLVHEKIAKKFLPDLFSATRNWNLIFRGCPTTCAILPEAVPAAEQDYYTEYNDYILSVLVVKSAEEAIEEINRTGTGHSEAIITENNETAERFFRAVDAAALYCNASTRFTDGGEFGYGAEIGISTQKLHARGPMGLQALTTVKYCITGDGAIRE